MPERLWGVISASQSRLSADSSRLTADLRAIGDATPHVTLPGDAAPGSRQDQGLVGGPQTGPKRGSGQSGRLHEGGRVVPVRPLCPHLQSGQISYSSVCGKIEARGPAGR